MTNEELVAEYQNGNDKAFDVLLENNCGIIHFMMNKFFLRLTDANITTDEMTNEGIFAFWLAVKDYKESKECSFGTYACNRISWHYGRLIMKHANSHKNQDGDFVQIVSLDDVIPGTDDLTLADTIADEDTEFDFEKMLDELSNKSLKEKINTFMNIVLTEQEKTVITFRFGLECKALNQGQIAERLNVSSQRVAQIEKTAIKKMRNSSLKDMFSDDYLQQKTEEPIEHHNAETESDISFEDALLYLNQL